LTNRGWGSLGQAEHGLQRLQWLGKEPFELREVKATATGFELAFTRECTAASAVAASFAVRSWTYDHHEGYGCPPRDTHAVAVTAVRRSADGRKVEIDLDDTTTCRVYEVKCAGVRDSADAAPWHGVAWYTRNLAP
ncbi:MAG: auracyanin family protein, partial [Planctomycetes bacterium]|nr:auracyanin family protein [Planctomycetota bacterium]